MLTINPDNSQLLIVDFQARLMPAIDGGEVAVRNTTRLIAIAKLIEITRLFTEQNARGLGPTIKELPVEPDQLFHKQTFDACRERGFLERVPLKGHVVVAGCEAHVCVQQTVLGLIAAGRKTYVVKDAIGSRNSDNKETALRRMERHGAEIVTTEMVVFEWLQTAEHPRFREGLALIK